MKNKNLVIGLVIGALILVGGGVFVLSSNKKAAQAPIEAPTENEILTLNPEEIGLELTTIKNNQEVVFSIGKPEGIKTIEYELTWGAKVEDKFSGSVLDVVHGDQSNGPIEMNGKPYKAEIVMGSCSDVCHYDKGVNNIKIILKITKTDGKLYQSERTLEP
ncbi:MAG: hypothetical protein A3D74_02790 [Candidatus Levybacteria bacterium RIFCSPHIGHO2_02_FULL_37_13]|nr:MAG: hypothetical protein A3D74_02790 [Candidatus Levybacteria bacterium RIFCSPHIGHO2_02_FULL_37_13]OGH30580.1 MAG: hypothetical protein A3E40_00995 [Candidatus Levybacteria bacterium RIFCSPHIGHO2_12_FULL_37_9]OGH39458.1 MAG: hypothetical protein A3B41_01100 [Candidatus Levybacteria bacterium RIFCSPLOWO2_01_FULL_37_26]